MRDDSVRKPDIVLGVVCGVLMAILASIVAVFQYVRTDGRAFSEFPGLTITLAIYLTAGIVGGAIFGLSLPLTTRRWGATLVGSFTAIPVYLAFSLADGQGPLPGVVMGAIAGAIIGYAVSGKKEAG